jgi:hypothetical protein
MRAAPGGGEPLRHELLVTAVTDRLGEVAQILFGASAPEVQLVDIWG